MYAITSPDISLGNTLKFLDHKDDGNFSIPGQNGPTPKRPQPKRPQPERPHETIRVTETASQKRQQPKRPHGMMEPNQNGLI